MSGGRWPRLGIPFSGGGGGPTTVINETFSGTLSAFSNTSGWSIASAQLNAAASVNWHAIVHSTDTGNASHWVKATLVTAGSVWCRASVVVRMDSSGNGYGIYWTQTDIVKFHLTTYAWASETTVSTSATQPTNGTVIGVTVDGVAGSGCTIRVWLDPTTATPTSASVWGANAANHSFVMSGTARNGQRIGLLGDDTGGSVFDDLVAGIF